MSQGENEEVIRQKTGESQGYADFLADIKKQVQTAQLQAVLSLSREVVGL